MSLDADAIVDRRRLRRKLTFWRVTAAAVAVLVVVGAAIALVPGNRLIPDGAYIARVKVQGLIRNNQDRVEALDPPQFRDRVAQALRAMADAHEGPPKRTSRAGEPAVRSPGGCRRDGGAND